MARAGKPKPERAVRARVTGRVQGVFFRDATVERARALGVLGWVRNEEDGSVRVHAEGEAGPVAALVEFLGEGPPAAAVADVELEEVPPEGHEQFAVRGVPAGSFVVRRYETARGDRFELRLELDGTMRCWTVPKEPSMDPSVKRMAIEAGDRPPAENDFEGALEEGRVTVWDHGPYEQGGRVAWPEALDRGHAVFVLHGERLRGGFALQRTRRGERPQWLLIKRRELSAA